MSGETPMVEAALGEATSVRLVSINTDRDVRVITWGPADGRPVMHFHGSSSSALERPVDLSMLHRMNVRLITIDRPGHGGSSEIGDRTLSQWGRDSEAIADALELDAFAISGWSVGGAHALAAAAHLGDRVESATVIGSYPPSEDKRAWEGSSFAGRIARWMAVRAPGAIRSATARSADRLRDDPATTLDALKRGAPPADIELLERDEFQSMMLPAISSAYSQGAGPGWESTMIVRPWDFDLGSITAPVVIWHGTDDSIVPIAAARFLAEAMPSAVVHEIEGAGHFLLFSRWEEILSEA